MENIVDKFSGLNILFYICNIKLKTNIMKVYQLEFDYFCGASWEYEDVNIIAENRNQMKEAFDKATKHISSRKFENDNEARKDLWNKVEKNIEVKTLNFPIINNEFY